MGPLLKQGLEVCSTACAAVAAVMPLVLERVVHEKKRIRGPIRTSTLETLVGRCGGGKGFSVSLYPA